MPTHNQLLINIVRTDESDIKGRSPMDTPTSAPTDEKTPTLEPVLAAELTKLAKQEHSKLAMPLENSAERIRTSVARLTSNSIEELQGLVSELQNLQEFLKTQVDSVQ